MEPLTLVRTAGLRGGYARGTVAVDGVTFDVSPGQLVALLGPNGGGKSTVLRALVGELPWREGDVYAAPAAHVPQVEASTAAFPVTASDVALMGAYGRTPWYRRIAAEERALASRALQRVGLAEHSTTPFGRLSGGQRRRALIARALVQDTPVLLLDEPLSGVDAPSARRIEALLEELRHEGRAVLVCTHDVNQARRFDRVLCLHGRQVAYGPPAEVLTAPVLQATYGSELILLEDGTHAVAVDHHAH